MFEKSPLDVVPGSSVSKYLLHLFASYATCSGIKLLCLAYAIQLYVTCDVHVHRHMHAQCLVRSGCLPDVYRIYIYIERENTYPLTTEAIYSIYGLYIYMLTTEAVYSIYIYI